MSLFPHACDSNKTEVAIDSNVGGAFSAAYIGVLWLKGALGVFSASRAVIKRTYCVSAGFVCHQRQEH